MITNRGWTAARLLLIGLLWTSMIRAQDSGTFQTTDGIRGSVTALVSPAPLQSWAPVQVELTNDGDQVRNLEVQIEPLHRAGPLRRLTWAVELGPGTKTQLLPAYVGHETFSEVRVSIFERGAPIAQVDQLQFRQRQFFSSVRRSSVPYSEINAIFVTTPESRREVDAVRLEFAAAFARTKYDLESPSGSIDVQNLPVAVEAYEPIDRVVLIGVEPADLSLSQRAALQAAIRSGRTAWIVPGANGEGNGWVLDPGRFEVRMKTLLAESSDGGNVEWDTFLVEGDPGRPSVERSVLEGDSAATLAFVRDYPDGLGQWRRVAARRGNEIPFEPNFEWSPIGKVTAASGSYRRPRSRAAELDWVEDVDARYRVEVPIVLVFGLIVTYLLGIGPILFWILKRKGRLIWLLWAQPVVVVSFLVATYCIGYLHFGAFAASYHTLVVQQPMRSAEERPIEDHEKWGYGYSLLTRYNPREGRFSVRCADGSLPVFRTVAQRDPDLEWRFDRDSRRLDGVVLPEWSYSHFMSSGPLRIGGTVRVQLDIVPTAEGRDDVQHQVTIRNDLPFPVSNPTFKLRERIVRVEREILPDETLILSEKQLTGALAGFPTPIARRFFEVMEGGTVRLVVEFDPERVPSGVPFAAEAEFEEESAHLVVVEQE